MRDAIRRGQGNEPTTTLENEPTTNTHQAAALDGAGPPHSLQETLPLCGGVKVRVESPVQPTESRERVEQAALRFLPGGAEPTDSSPADPGSTSSPERIVLVGSELHSLRQRVWELRIIDTFRGKFQHGIQPDGRTIRFSLSKQAALAGKVSFPPRPHALGDLEWTVHIEPGDPWKDAEALSWWLAPETRDGEIVGPVE